MECANSGVTLEAYMQQNIWDSLRIQDMTFHLEKKERVKQNLVETSTRVPEFGLLIPGTNDVLPGHLAEILETPLANAALTANAATTTEFTWGTGG